MGYAVVAAAGIVLASLAVAGFHVTRIALEAQHTLDDSRLAAESRARAALLTQASIASVNATGGDVAVSLHNAGAATIDGRTLSLLLDGQPHDIASRQVAGRTTDVWAPGQDILVHATAAAPSSIELVGATGPLAFWRA